MHYLGLNFKRKVVFCFRNRETEALRCEAGIPALSPCPSWSSVILPHVLHQFPDGEQVHSPDPRRDMGSESCTEAVSAFPVFRDNSVSSGPFSLSGVYIWKALHHHLVVDLSWKNAPVFPGRGVRNAGTRTVRQFTQGRDQVPITEECGR